MDQSILFLSAGHKNKNMEMEGKLKKTITDVLHSVLDQHMLLISAETFHWSTNLGQTQTDFLKPKTCQQQ